MISLWRRIDTDFTDTLYDYDAQGRLWHVTLTKVNGATLSTPQVTTYTYDALGNLKAVAQPNGLLTTYDYDALNRLDLETVTHDGSEIARYDYHLRSDGLRDWVEEHQADADVAGQPRTFSDVRIRWEYDADGRLVSEFRDDHTGSHTLSTDGTPNDPGDYLDVFAYDLNSNRMRQTHADNNTTTVTAYAYNGDDQLTAEGPDANGDGMPDPITATTYDYDDNGSQQLVTRPDGTFDTYSYDVRNKLIGATVNGVTSTYLYDDIGNRVKETVSGTILYVIDAINPTGYGQPIEERPSATAAPHMTYVIGDHVFGQADDSGAISYLLTDGHGSTRLLTDADGAVTAALNYTAFGGAVGFNPTSVGTIFLFAGDGVYDVASGLTFHGAGRPSDNVRGRFLQRDDPGYDNNHDPITHNLYLLDGADPVNGIDPSGHLKIQPSISRMIAALTVQVAVRLLVGMEATYVLGEAYKDEVNNSKGVFINRQIGRQGDGDLPDGVFLKEYKNRPDILDTDLHTVYEIKSDFLSARGAKDVDGYIATLGKRYPGQIFTPGTWRPKQEYYTIVGLPGIQGLPEIKIHAENVGHGVIAYTMVDNGLTELISLLIALPKVTAAVNTERSGRGVTTTAIATLIGVFGLV